MKKARPVALIASGNFTDSPVTRLLRLSSRLGPVLSPSYRVASRLANSLRAGHPVKDYVEFDECCLIVISVPDEKLAPTVAGLAAAGISWHGKGVMVCSTWLGSCELETLAACGASVGSISPIPGFEDSWYLVEGDNLAIRETKGLVERSHRRLVTIERHRKRFYLASLTCTGSLAFASLLAASEALRHAGVSQVEAAAMMEKQCLKALRSYLKAGRKGFPGVHEISKQVSALAAADAELAHYVEQSSRLAVRLMESGKPKLAFMTAQR
ncbi:MAG TPA: hypothetical protein VEU96_30895 [Bryobacteraceae bacterium]|nr:hypothetical protein [Bryobacteraceae bacterium]